MLNKIAFKEIINFSTPSLIRGLGTFLIITPISTYYLSVIDIGISAVIISLANLVTAFADLGVIYVLNANYYNLQSDQRKILLFNLFIFNLLSHLVVVAIFILLGNFLLSIFEIPESGNFYFLFILAVFASGIFFFYTIVTQLFTLNKNSIGFLKFDFINWLSSTIVLFLCFECFKLGLTSIFISMLFASVFSLSQGLLINRNNFRVEISKHWAKEILNVGVPTIPMSILESLVNSIDKFFIQKNIGALDLAIYSHSVSYRGVFFSLTKAHARILGPDILMYLNEKRNSLYVKIRTQFLIWNLLLFCGYLIIIFFAEPIINIITHGKLNYVVKLIPLWIYLLVIQSYALPHIYVIQSMKNTPLLTRIYLASNLFLFLLIFIFSLTKNIILVVVGYLIAKLFWAFLLRFYSKGLFLFNRYFDFTFFFTTLIFILTYILKFHL